MKKIAYILTIVLSVCSLFMFGCTNKYKNLKLELESNEITIEVVEGEESFKNISATVTGAGKGVSTAVIFSTQSTNITLVPQEQVNNTTECKVIANPNGTGNQAVVTVATQEGGKTANVTVHLVRAIQSASYNEEYNPAVSINGRLKINTGLAINMVPENTTEDEFTYDFPEEFKTNYNSNGIFIENGELIVGETMPEQNKIFLIATNNAKQNITVNFAVSVVRAINLREQVNVNADGKEIEELVIAPNIQTKVALKFENKLGMEESYYSFHVESQNLNIVSNPVATSNINEFTIVANTIGETKLVVTAYVTGFDMQFASYTFELAVKVKNVPTGINLITKDYSTGASTVIKETDVLTIYDVYATGILGTQLTTVLTPTPTDVNDSTFSIREVGTGNYLSKLDIVYSDESSVSDLTNLSNTVNLFFKVNKDFELTEIIEFEIEIVSDFNNEVKQAVKVRLVKGISDLSVLKDEQNISSLKIIKGNIATLTVKATGSSNEVIEVTEENIKLDFGVTGASYISAQRNAEKPAEFEITANTCGNTKIIFNSNNGISLEIEVIVYQPYKTFTANFEMPNSDIGEQTFVDGANSNSSVEKLVFALSSSLKINISYFADEEKKIPVDATILNAYITSSDPLSVAVFNKLYITGRKAETFATLTLYIDSYNENGERKTDRLEFKAKSYVPLTQVQLNHNSLTLLDSNTLSALDRSSGETILELRLSPINATFNAGDDITWSVPGAELTENGYELQGHRIKLDSTSLNSNKTKVSVFLNGTMESATITVTATAKQYARSYTQSCTITVQKCVQINNLEITNIKEYLNPAVANYDLYFNATKGLADSNSVPEAELSDGKDNFFKLTPRISPANVTNSNVVYVVKNWNNETDSEIVNAEKPVVLVANDGRVFANTAGFAKIYVIPADCLSEPIEGKPKITYNGTEYFYDQSLTKIIYVQVADGTKTNKIRIETPADFVSINTIKGLSLHYELHNNIDLAGVGSIYPIGYVYSVETNQYEIKPFTGSIDGCLKDKNGNNNYFNISNVNLEGVAYQGVHVGLFGNLNKDIKLNQTAEIKNLTVYVNKISLSNFQLGSQSKVYIGTISAINTTGTISNCNVFVNNIEFQHNSESNPNPKNSLAGHVKFGGISGINGGNIENCKVSGNVTLGYTTSIANIAFGGIAGENSGTISGTESKQTGSNSTEFVSSYNFSDVDVMLNITTANANIKINENEDLTAVNFGGVAGTNSGTIQNMAYGGVLKGYSKLGGIAGQNSGAVSNCVNQGNVYSVGGSHIGGIVAHNTTIIDESGTTKTGTISNCSLQAFNYVGKTINHTAIVGYNKVGGIVGVADDEEKIENCYVLSYYSLRTIENYTNGISNYETDNLGGTGYYGDILVFNKDGYNKIGLTNSQTSTSTCSVYVQVVDKETTKFVIADTVNTVPTSITASVSVENETFADQPTKLEETKLLLPFFEELNASNLNSETIYSKNTHKIADLIKVSCVPAEATQKFIVQTSNSNVISLDNQGKLHVVGLGKAILTISSIFNSCEPKTIEVISSYPIANKISYINSNNQEPSKLVLRKAQNSLLTPVMSYKLAISEIECKVANGISIEAIIEDSDKSYVDLDKNIYSYTLNSSIVVSALEKTTEDVKITFTPSLKVEGENVTTSLQQISIPVSVTEGATDVTFSHNNLEVSQIDTVEFTVYVNTDVEVNEFAVEDISAFENLTYAYNNSQLQVIAGTPYEYAENIIAVKFIAKLNNTYQVFTEDTSFEIVFTDSTIYRIENNNKIFTNFTFNFIVKAQKVESIYANNYNGIKDSSSTLTYINPDNSNSITPGNTSVLEIDVYPFYANIKDITVVNTGSSEDNVTFEQVIRTGNVKENETKDGFNYSYKSLFPRADFITDGIKALPISKTTGIENDNIGTIFNHDNIKYLFDGKIYLKTLIKSGVSENSKYELTITVTTLENITIQKVITLKAVHSLSIEMTYTYAFENGGSDVRTASAIEIKNDNDKTNAPTIYLPAGKQNCGGELIIKTIGFNGEPTIKWGNLGHGGNNPYTLSTEGLSVGDTGTIEASINIPLGNGTNVEQTICLNYLVVDIVIPNLVLAKDSTVAIDKILDIQVGKEDQQLLIYDENWIGSGFEDIINELTKSKVELNDNKLTVKRDILARYWFVVEESGKTTEYKPINYLSQNLSNSIEVVTDDNGKHYLRAKNTLSNQTIACRFEYYYNNGKLTLVKQSEPSGQTTFTASAQFTTNIGIYTDPNLPAPIYSQEDFETMAENQHYILMNDIELENYLPISTKVASFDGNGFNINIKNYGIDLNNENSTLSDTLNLGLFEEVSKQSTIKNVKVVINNQNNFDLSNTYRSVNYGTIAAINNGVITNCTVSFEDVQVKLVENVLGRKYYAVSGATYGKVYNEATKTFIEASKPTFSLEFTTNESLAGDLVNNIGGLVGVNNGYITNSKVEQPLNIVVNIPTKQITGSADSTGLENTYKPHFVKTALTECRSKLVGNGNVAGLVASNQGIIASSYVKGIEIINKGAQSSSKNTTSGFVGENGASAKIAYSYVEGTFKQFEDSDYDANKKVKENTPTQVRATASGITSNGNIGAFIYLNKGFISNCYANIKVSTNARASGFVYDNSTSGSSIESCFTLSAIEYNNNAHTPFTGTSTTEVLANNNVYASYYLRINGNSPEESEDFGNTENEPASEIDLLELQSKGTFNTYSFVNSDKNFDLDENKYIWKMASPNTNVNDGSMHEYPQLITANQITVSMRKVYIEKTDIAGETVVGGSVVSGYPQRGGTTEIPNYSGTSDMLTINNPYIIATQQDYVNVIKNTTTHETQHADGTYDTSSRKVLNAILRFVCDIEFDNTLVNSPSASVIFKGALDGNGMTISNIRVNTNNLVKGQNSLGFFSELNGNPDNQFKGSVLRTTYGATIKNLNFEFTEVYGNNIAIVGGVAGKVENGFLLNVSVSGKNVVAVGKNITGGVFGIMLGGSRAVNLDSSISVSSEFRNNQIVEDGYTLYSATYSTKNIPDHPDTEAKYFIANITDLNKLSYAGGVGGIVDVYGTDSSNINSQTDIDDVQVTGTASVLAENVGGIFGLVGAKTKVSSAYNLVSSRENSLYATKVAGGLVGELRGTLERSKIEHSQQKLVEQTELGRISNTANTTYFKGTNQAIGGIVGFLNHGEIKNCYSKIDVRNQTSKFAGGAVGRLLNGSVSTTYASGSVLAEVVGGFIGHVANKDSLIKEGALFENQSENEEFEPLFTSDDNIRIVQNCVAVNNWLFADYEQAILMGNAFNTFIGAVTKGSTSTTYVENYATSIMFGNSFSTSTTQTDNNGKMFNYNSDSNGDTINYCLNINGNFVNGEDFSVIDGVVSGNFDWVDIKLCHPAKMVKTDEALGVEDNSSKNKIYDKFSKVLWTGHTDNSLRYIELTSRTELFRIPVSSWNEIENAINNRSDAHIFLEKDIVVQGIIEQPFTGTVEGNGFAFVFTNDTSYGSEYDYSKSTLHVAQVKVGSQSIAEDDKVEQHCFGVFAMSNGAWFDKVNVRIEKEINVEENIQSLTTKNNELNTAYIGLLVAYATDGTAFSNCFIYSTDEDYKLNVKANNTKLTNIHAGGLVGYLESSTILTDNSIDVAPSKSSKTTLSTVEIPVLTNGVHIAVETFGAQVNLGGIVGATGRVTGGAFAKIVNLLVSNTAIVEINDSCSDKTTGALKAQNNIGGLVGNAVNLTLSNIDFYGKLDNGGAQTYDFDNTEIKYNNIGVLLGQSDNSSVQLGDISILSKSEPKITGKNNAYFEVNNFIGNGKCKFLDNDIKVDVEIKYNYQSGGYFKSADDLLDIQNKFKTVSHEQLAEEFVTNTFSPLVVSVRDNTDQVIAVDLDPTIEYANKEHWPTLQNTEFIYGGNSDEKGLVSKEYGKEVSLKTYYASDFIGSFAIGTYTAKSTTITAMNNSYEDRPVLIPEYVGDNEINSVNGGVTEYTEHNGVYGVFKDIYISGFVSKNEKYLTHNFDALYNNNEDNSQDYSTLYMFANNSKTLNYAIHNNCTQIKAYAFNSAKVVQKVTNLNKITEIKRYTFAGAESLQAVLGLTNVQTIGTGAFKGNTSVACVTDDTAITNGAVSLPKTTTIGISAFDGCIGITTLYAPAVTIIREKAFQGCANLTSLIKNTVNGVAYNSLTTLSNLGPNAFTNTALNNVYFPVLTYVGNGAFSNMNNLNEVVIGARLLTKEDEIIEYKYTDRLRFTSNIDADTAIKIGKGLFTGTNNLEYLTMPLSTYEENGAENENFAYTFYDVFKSEEPKKYSATVNCSPDSNSYDRINFSLDIKLSSYWTPSTKTLNLYITGVVVPDKACLGMENVNINICGGVKVIGKYSLSASIKNAIFIPSTVEYLSEGMAYMIPGNYTICKEAGRFTACEVNGLSVRSHISINKNMYEIYKIKTITSAKNLTTISERYGGFLALTYVNPTWTNKNASTYYCETGTMVLNGIYSILNNSVYAYYDPVNFTNNSPITTQVFEKDNSGQTNMHLGFVDNYPFADFGYSSMVTSNELVLVDNGGSIKKENALKALFGTLKSGYSYEIHSNGDLTQNNTYNCTVSDNTYCETITFETKGYTVQYTSMPSKFDCVDVVTNYYQSKYPEKSTVSYTTSIKEGTTEDIHTFNFTIEIKDDSGKVVKTDKITAQVSVTVLNAG